MNVYDRSGNPIEFDEFLRLIEKEYYQRLNRTEVGDCVVSTVWLGFSHGHTIEGPPLIFETMAFGRDGLEKFTYRYATESDALRGHQEVVDLLELEGR